MGWTIAGGTAVICVVVAGAILLWKPPAAPQQPPSGREDSPASDWGKPLRVDILNDKKDVQTTFSVGLKDAWYSDYACSPQSTGRTTFVVVYQYANLGPREAPEPLASANVTPEIRTNRGHIFPGTPLGRPGDGFVPAGPERNAFWCPKDARRIGETGESALVFSLPKDELPTGVQAHGMIDIDLKLPQYSFGFRRYDENFGFLPQSLEKAVACLMTAMRARDEKTCVAAMGAVGRIGPQAKDAAPALARRLQDKNPRIRRSSTEALGRVSPPTGEVVVLLIKALGTDDRLENREAAANALGRLGPGAREAVPALQQALGAAPSSEPSETAAVEQFHKAVREALAQIGGAELARAAPPPERKVPQDELAGAFGAASHENAAREEDNPFDRPTRIGANGDSMGGPSPESPSTPGKPSEPQAPWLARKQQPQPKTEKRLTGKWKNKEGATFRIDDDGKTLTVKKITVGNLFQFSGSLTRDEDTAGPASFSGTFQPVFAFRAGVRYKVKTTAILGPSGQLNIRCEDWPFQRRDGSVHQAPLNDTWTRE